MCFEGRLKKIPRFGVGAFRRPLGRYGLECLSICDGLVCLPAFGVAADEVSVV